MNTRANLKERARTVLRGSYWKAFLISIIVLITNGQTNGNQGFNYRMNTHPNDIFKNVEFMKGPRSFKSSEFFTRSEMFNGEMFWPMLAIGIAVIFFIIVISVLVKLFLGNPIIVSSNKYYKDASLGEANLNNLGYCFKDGKYLSRVMTMFMMDLFIFLWTLLLIIPGIIKSYAYSMVPYLLASDPSLDYKQALSKSKELMAGNKGRLFVLDLSFIGWFLLGLLAFGIGIIFVIPYHTATRIEFFNDVYGETVPENLMGETV